MICPRRAFLAYLARQAARPVALADFSQHLLGFAQRTTALFRSPSLFHRR
jgi:hypothetical protein